MEKAIYVSGYEAFRKVVDTFAGTAQLNIYFTGEKNADNISWCPDCNEAEPQVRNALEKYADKDSTFLIVNVGPREFWKDMTNPFRKDADVKLSVIPTLLRWKAVERLDGGQCNKENLLQMFFTEDAD